jgi:hypothetical protein
VQGPAKKHVNGHEHLNNHDLQVGERRQLPKLCRKCAGQLIVVQVPATKHMNRNGHDTKPPRTIATYKLLRFVNCPICVGIVPLS